MSLQVEPLTLLNCVLSVLVHFTPGTDSEEWFGRTHVPFPRNVFGSTIVQRQLDFLRRWDHTPQVFGVLVYFEEALYLSLPTTRGEAILTVYAKPFCALDGEMVALLCKRTIVHYEGTLHSCEKAISLTFCIVPNPYITSPAVSEYRFTYIANSADYQEVQYPLHRFPLDTVAHTPLAPTDIRCCDRGELLVVQFVMASMLVLGSTNAAVDARLVRATRIVL